MHGVVCSAVLVFGLSVAAEPPVLPPPREVVAPPVLIAPPALPPGIGFYRPNPNDIGLYYAPDRFGRMRPRAIQVPGGDVYRLIDGRLIPAPNSHPLEFMPYAGPN